MKTASVNELKQELLNIPQKDLAELCLRLAKFKKENKELLTFLLFEAHDVQSYINSVKALMDEEFTEVHKTNLYYVKKNLRRILRTVSKHIKYTGSKQAEAELLIHFCKLIKQSGITLGKSTALYNMYTQQLKKINAAIATMHEDLQYDLMKEVEHLV
ncbi:hypothetical protein FRZ67_10910 [Panacibacter ginsenosidivorans]|uniref:Uncharacterized protein n=1 Tax=Panacibacter ginsenosidivorans TaxID=1813871 RepID=A0A5B8V8B9_9BACT|nr:hypothetical protein [Panacibacter ginsenosidivorans]QEC67780.1 hypothetical protein FRZ67_10910 [Panacibacter ginsenosidivorans]